jgi:hypothetical protein
LNSIIPQPRLLLSENIISNKIRLDIICHVTMENHKPKDLNSTQLANLRSSRLERWLGEFSVRQAEISVQIAKISRSLDRVATFRNMAKSSTISRSNSIKMLMW